MEDINYALETDEQPVQQVQEVEENQVEVGTEEVGTEVQEVTTPEQTPTAPTQFDIDGIGSVTVDQVKEWYNGHLRQSDYTRKTQELAEQRKEAERAIEFYKYMESNPHLVEGLKRIQAGMQTQIPQPVQQATEFMNPVMQELTALKAKLAQQELDNKITTLKSKYNDFNEVEVINEAQKRGLDDLEFVYKAMKAEKVPNVEELTAQIRNQILQEIENNKQATSTIIKGEGAKKNTNTVNLTPQQLHIAEMLGVTPEEYAKNL